MSDTVNEPEDPGVKANVTKLLPALMGSMLLLMPMGLGCNQFRYLVIITTSMLPTLVVPAIALEIQ